MDMSRINKDSLATLEFDIKWKSDLGSHRERYLAQNVNFWRDLFPTKLSQYLLGAREGDRVRATFMPGEVGGEYRSDKVFEIKDKQFDRRKINGRSIEPRYGRFYPKGILKDMPGIYRINVQPFRCVDVDECTLSVDFNHPMAKYGVDVDVTVHEVRNKQSDRGGRLTDWIEEVADGPGMQIRTNGKPTDFFSKSAFSRNDENRDSVFYEKPRLVHHIDAQARAHVSDVYRRTLKPNMAVLDLMSSWKSHLPKSVPLDSVIGLGLNDQEMANNSALSGHTVHDLNVESRLPFEDQSFDAVLCTASVEYLTRPFEVFREVARVLRPGGLFVNTFSNRWFPPKAISLWSELSEFERMGLVSEYFMESGAYGNLKTYSARGWDRPEDDRYFGENPVSDPLYAVWAEKRR